MHFMLEVYYGLKFQCARFDSESWKTLIEAGLYDPSKLIGWNYDEENKRITLCKEIGRFWATKMDADPLELEEVIYQFEEYCKFYKNDIWKIKAVEEVGMRILHEDEEFKIVYVCKTDLIAEHVSLFAPWDHKTGERNQTPHNTSNQFRGTCFVLGVNVMIINKIGFQKTLSPAERFLRYPLEISNSLIEEWRQDTIYWAKVLDFYMTNDYWPRNYTGCDKYSGCLYRSLCEKSPEYRLNTEEMLYHIGESWDVSKVLEAE